MILTVYIFCFPNCKSHHFKLHMYMDQHYHKLICSFIQVLGFILRMIFLFLIATIVLQLTILPFIPIQGVLQCFVSKRVVVKNHSHYKTVLNMKITINVLKYLQILFFEPIMYMYILF